MPSTSEDQRNVLQAARDRSRDYSSESTREDLVTAFKKAFRGLEPGGCWVSDRAAHRNRILRFVRYGCTGKTSVPSSPQTCELTAVNRIETVNFSRITASYGYTGACSVIS